MWGRRGDADPTARRDLRRRTPEYLSTAEPPPGAAPWLAVSLRTPGRPAGRIGRTTLRRWARGQLQERPVFTQLGVALFLLHVLVRVLHPAGAPPDASQGAVVPPRNPVLQLPPCPDARQDAACDGTGLHRPTGAVVVDPSVFPTRRPQP